MFLLKRKLQLWHSLSRIEHGAPWPFLTVEFIRTSTLQLWDTLIESIIYQFFTFRLVDELSNTVYGLNFVILFYYEPFEVAYVLVLRQANRNFFKGEGLTCVNSLVVEYCKTLLLGIWSYEKLTGTSSYSHSSVITQPINFFYKCDYVFSNIHWKMELLNVASSFVLVTKYY